MSVDPPKAQASYRAEDLLSFATSLLAASGMAIDRSRIVAETLLEGDLMGHTTHGLQLLSLYLDAIRRKTMHLTGEPEPITDRGSAVTWDGCWLPGPWLVRHALDLAFARIEHHPVVTVVIRRAGHIGCLAAYPRLATERGLMMLLTCSDPSVASVAPHGGVAGRYTPNPIAAGWPTDTEPVIIDVCPSTLTNGAVIRAQREGRRLPGPWLIGPDGQPSDDPALLAAEPPAAILPLGGLELGHKGFALGLLVEALTSALAGFGRADATEHWGAAVFLQVIDPGAFSGEAAFRRETGWFAASCEAAPAWPDGPPVRLPGRRGLAMRSRQLWDGVLLHPQIMPQLAGWAAELGVQTPAPMSVQEVQQDL
jgi:LDH2 family malate/lactate/ureidoglycolate dehydrogenase